jgi:hypothetical protein
VLTVWHAHVYGEQGQYRQRVVFLGVNSHGERSREFERVADRLSGLAATDKGVLSPARRLELLRREESDILCRELTPTGVLIDGATCAARLLAWVELS